MALFQPGQSGNPGGRPAGTSLRAALRAKYGQDAPALIAELDALAMGRRLDPETGAVEVLEIAPRQRIEALKLLLSYHSGAPDKYIELAGPGGSALGPVTFVVRERTPKAEQ